MRLLSCALVCGLLSWNAAAQSSAQCDDIGTAGSRMVSRQTQQASEVARELVRKAGVDADLRSIRQRVLRDEFPKADVDVTLRRMLQEFCRIVWAAADLAADNKVARVRTAEDEILKRVEGPAEVARTNSRIRSSGPAPLREPVLAAVPAINPVRWTVGGVELTQAGATNEEFLRDPPAYVNESNKYFVIVGSVPSEQGAVRLMNRLKAKAPKYDFVVYMPYGGNPNYAVMMATWVSKEVADKALRAARAEVVSDAYLWACRSSGESC
jgi:SPOR domain